MPLIQAMGSDASYKPGGNNGLNINTAEVNKN
jgi:hypothetical protein